MPIVCACVCACGHLGRSPLGLGSSGLDKGFANQGLTTSSSIGSRDTAYSLIGSCKVNRNFAVEGSYFDLGRFNDGSTVTAPAAGSVNGRYSAWGYGLSAVGIVPFGQGFAAYGKAGLAYTRAELEASSSGDITANGMRSSGTNPTYGAGLSYDFTRNIVGKAEWNRYARVGDSNTGRGDIDMYSVGVAYKF